MCPAACSGLRFFAERAAQLLLAIRHLLDCHEHLVLFLRHAVVDAETMV
jgi:hypothetical protein